MIVSPLTGGSAGSPESSFVVVEWKDEGVTSRERPVAGLHLHRADDECWYVLEGALGFLVGDEEFEASAGDAVFVERGTPHSYWNAHAGRTRYLLVMPRRIADLVGALHAGPNVDYAAIFERYESELLV